MLNGFAVKKLELVANFSDRFRMKFSLVVPLRHQSSSMLRRMFTELRSVP